MIDAMAAAKRLCAAATLDGDLEMRGAEEILRHWSCLLVSCIAWSLLTMPSSAQITFSDIIGGPGGSKFIDTCGDTEALVGIDYSVARWINSVRPLCQALSEAYPEGPVVGLSVWGKPAGTGGSLRCPPKMVLAGLSVQISSDNYVNGFTLICTDLITNYQGFTDNTLGSADVPLASKSLAFCKVDPSVGRNQR